MIPSIQSFFRPQTPGEIGRIVHRRPSPTPPCSRAFTRFLSLHHPFTAEQKPLFPGVAFPKELEWVLGEHLSLADCSRASKVSKAFCKMQRLAALSKCQHLEVTCDGFSVVNTCHLSRPNLVTNDLPTSHCLTLNWRRREASVTSIWHRAKELLAAIPSSGLASVTTLIIKCPRRILQEALNSIPLLSCAAALLTIEVYPEASSENPFNVYSRSLDTTAATTHFLNSLPHLKVLKLRNVVVDSSQIVDMFPGLETLHMYKCLITPCTSLRDLGCLVDVNVDQSCSAMPQSEFLLLDGVSLGSLTIEHDPDSIKLTHCQTLEHIALSHFDMHPEPIDQMPFSEKLRSLRMEFYHETIAGDLALIDGQWNGLRCLAIQGWTRFTDFDLRTSAITHMEILPDNGGNHNPPSIVFPLGLLEFRGPYSCLDTALECSMLQVLIFTPGSYQDGGEGDIEWWMEKIGPVDEHVRITSAARRGAFSALTTVSCHPGQRIGELFNDGLQYRHPDRESFETTDDRQYCYWCADFYRALAAGPSCIITRIIHAPLMPDDFGVISALARMEKLTSIVLVRMHLSCVDIALLVDLPLVQTIDLVDCSLPTDGRDRLVWVSRTGRAVQVVHMGGRSVRLV